eukprot:TRINITY_DN4857_c0_g1_i7.p1 TRINITY_DN4857_c0_g1~~TRINITY_DN4857_c0_g1_i7.p1  ORF type:complete len:107 (+),score=9.08 TRINITY_DN4857_c0_g1_i7:318-638(+)
MRRHNTLHVPPLRDRCTAPPLWFPHTPVMAASRMPYLAAVSQDGEAYPLLAKAEFMVVGVPGGLVAWLNTTTVAIDKNITYQPALSYLTDSVGNLLAKYSGDTVAR